MPRELYEKVEKCPAGRSRDADAADLAARQEGVFSWWQLREVGFSDKLIRRRLESARLFEIFARVYSLSPAVSVRGRFMAGALSCGNDAVLSYSAAPAVWDLCSWPNGLIHVTSPRSCRRQPGLRIHRAELAPAERTVRDGFPVTSMTRTILDNASIADRESLARLIDSADGQGLFDLDGLVAAVPGRRGARKLRSILADYAAPEPTRSVFEEEFRAFCKRHRLPLPNQNVPLLGYEADALWQDERVVVELDSWEFHRTRMQFEHDRNKAATLERARYRVLRFTWRQMRREAADTAETIRRALREGRKMSGW